MPMRHPRFLLLTGTFIAFVSLSRLVGLGSDPLSLFAMCLSIAIICGSLGRLLRAHIGAINWLNVIGALFGLAASTVGVLWLLSFISPWIVITACAVLFGMIVALKLLNNTGQRELWALSGKCMKCGYDLRASEECCPECGADLPEEIQRRRRVAAELAAARLKAQNEAPETSHQPAE
jgi:hypothetical protein